MCCSNNQQNFFLHKSLEKLKLELGIELNNFLDYLGENAFVDNVQSDFAGLVGPDEMVERHYSYLIRTGAEVDYNNLIEEAKEEFDNKREKLNLMSIALFEKYNKLISKAHKIL